MVRVLFVDDEPKVLSGLERVLGVIRSQWDSHYCTDPADATDYLNDLDVVVSDLRMPNVDGNEFLSVVRQVSPSTIRLVLSGYGDQHTIISSSTSAHQFLAKPFAASELADHIDRLVERRSYFGNEEIWEAVNQIDSLVTPEPTAIRLMELLRETEPDLTKITELIRTDPALTAKIFQIGASLRGDSKNTTLESALALIGTDGLWQLTSMAELFRLPSGEQESTAATRIAEESVEFANKAAQACLDKSKQSNAYVAGLLKPLGALIAISHPEVFDKPDPPTPEALASYLLYLWGIPAEIANAISEQHNAVANALTKARSSTSEQ